MLDFVLDNQLLMKQCGYFKQLTELMFLSLCHTDTVCFVTVGVELVWLLGICYKAKTVVYVSVCVCFKEFRQFSIFHTASIKIKY